MAYDKDRQLAIDFLKRELSLSEIFCAQTRGVILSLEKLQKIVSKPTIKSKREISVVSLSIEILKNSNRFLHTPEIKQIVKEDFPEVNPDYLIQVYSRSKKLTNKIAKIPLSDSMKTAYYGMKEWLDENGEIKSAYKPK